MLIPKIKDKKRSLGCCYDERNKNHSKKEKEIKRKTGKTEVKDRGKSDRLVKFSFISLFIISISLRKKHNVTEQ